MKSTHCQQHRYSGFFVVVTILAGMTSTTTAVGQEPTYPLSLGDSKSATSEQPRSNPDGIATISVLTILILGSIAFLYLRRYRSKETHNGLRVISRTALTPKHSICLVRVGSKTLMIGVGPQGPPTLLGDLEVVEVPTTANSTQEQPKAQGDTLRRDG